MRCKPVLAVVQPPPADFDWRARGPRDVSDTTEAKPTKSVNSGHKAFTFSSEESDHIWHTAEPYLSEGAGKVAKPVSEDIDEASF